MRLHRLLKAIGINHQPEQTAHQRFAGTRIKFDGSIRGRGYFHSIYPLTDVMRKNARIKYLVAWCNYQAMRDLLRLTPDNQAAVKELVEKMLGEQKAAGK